MGDISYYRHYWLTSAGGFLKAIKNPNTKANPGGAQVGLYPFSGVLNLLSEDQYLVSP